MGAIAESLPDLLPAAVDVFFDTLVALLTDLPTLIKVGAQFAVGLVEGIFSAIPRLLSGIGDVFTALFTDNFRIADAVAEQTADMRAAFENIQDEIAQANEAFADQQESILASAEVAEQYAGIIDQLSGKDLNAGEMAQLQAAVEGLNALYPDLNLQIDEQGRLIGIAKDEIHEYIQASTQMALTEAYLQKIKDNTAALVDVQIAQREAVEEYDAALAQKTSWRPGRQSYCNCKRTSKTDVLLPSWPIRPLTSRQFLLWKAILCSWKTAPGHYRNMYHSTKPFLLHRPACLTFWAKCQIVLKSRPAQWIPPVARLEACKGKSTG